MFGVPAEMNYGNTPTRLIVRDLHLSEDSAQVLEALPLDRPYMEMKTEVSIDRITSQANPRPLERVPAGAVFGPGELVYTIYSGDGLADPDEDVERLAVVFRGMSLLEHDYLGGMGSRGSGKVKFEEIQLTLRAGTDYFTKAIEIATVPDVETLLAKQKKILAAIRRHLGL